MKKKPLAGKKSSKKVLLYSILFGVFVVISVIALGTLLNQDSEQSDAIRFRSEYPLVGEDNVFVYKNISEIADILESGTGAVFLGFPTCIWCQTYAAILHEAAVELGVEKIYYGNVRLDRQNNTSPYQRILRALKDYLELDSEGRPQMDLPDFSVVIDGVIIGHDNETSTEDGSTPPHEYWTNARANALKLRLRAMLKELL